MALSHQDVMDAITHLSEDQNLRVCVKESLKGGAIVGAAALIGGLLGGRNGLLAGGLAGSVLGYTCSNEFKSVVEVIDEMPDEKREALASMMRDVFSKFNVQDLQSLVLLLSSDSAAQQLCVQELRTFLNSQCNLQILD